MRKIWLVIFLLSCGNLWAQNVTEIKPMEGEYWWGGAIGLGAQQPYISPMIFNLEIQNVNNQVVPLLLSNKGRYIWSEYPFIYKINDDGGIIIDSRFEKVSVQNSGSTLRDAYLAASAKYSPLSGELPDTLFFTMPQYNTWIELMYDQNQEDILKYAKGILDNGFPPGIIMIDDNWQKYYGNFEFKPDKFPDPKGMVDQLHEMGFKVMVWICPYVSPDSPEYRFLNSKGYLIKRENGRPAILNWWNGQSACFDLTNPEAAQYYKSALKEMQSKYGVDGFKLDAGDPDAYSSPNLVSYKKDALTVDHTLEWMKIGLEFPVNEYRAGWKMGGEALVYRLGDKHYSW